MIGNRVTEADIRNWLTENGFVGRTAKFVEVELHAIRRPGWLQIYRFNCNAKCKSNEQWTELWGAVKDDERERQREHKTIVAAFEDPDLQRQQLEKWVADLDIVGGQQAPANWFAVTTIVAICAAVIGAVAIARAMFGS